MNSWPYSLQIFALIVGAIGRPELVGLPAGARKSPIDSFLDFSIWPKDWDKALAQGKIPKPPELPIQLDAPPSCTTACTHQILPILNSVILAGSNTERLHEACLQFEKAESCVQEMTHCPRNDFYYTITSGVRFMCHEQKKAFENNVPCMDKVNDQVYNECEHSCNTQALVAGLTAKETMSGMGGGFDSIIRDFVNPHVFDMVISETCRISQCLLQCYRTKYDNHCDGVAGSLLSEAIVRPLDTAQPLGAFFGAWLPSQCRFIYDDSIRGKLRISDAQQMDLQKLYAAKADAKSLNITSQPNGTSILSQSPAFPTAPTPKMVPKQTLVTQNTNQVPTGKSSISGPSRPQTPIKPINPKLKPETKPNDPRLMAGPQMSPQKPGGTIVNGFSGQVVNRDFPKTNDLPKPDVQSNSPPGSRTIVGPNTVPQPGGSPKFVPIVPQGPVVNRIAPRINVPQSPQIITNRGTQAPPNVRGNQANGQSSQVHVIAPSDLPRQLPKNFPIKVKRSVPPKNEDPLNGFFEDDPLLEEEYDGLIDNEDEDLVIEDPDYPQDRDDRDSGEENHINNPLLKPLPVWHVVEDRPVPKQIGTPVIEIGAQPGPDGITHLYLERTMDNADLYLAQWIHPSRSYRIDLNVPPDDEGELVCLLRTYKGFAVNRLSDADIDVLLAEIEETSRQRKTRRVTEKPKD